MSAQGTKGKQATRGEKTIIAENQDTLSFYRNVILVIMSVTVGFTMLLYMNSLTTTYYVMNGITAALFLGAYKFMSFMATVTRASNGEIVDCGNDLNIPGGMADHCKDVIILTAIAQILSMFSQWFSLLLLLMPLRALYMFWVNIAAPWIFAPAPEEDPLDDKRRKRLERRQTKIKRA